MIYLTNRYNSLEIVSLREHPVFLALVSPAEKRKIGIPLRNKNPDNSVLTVLTVGREL